MYTCTCTLDVFWSRISYINTQNKLKPKAHSQNKNCTKGINWVFTKLCATGGGNGLERIIKSESNLLPEEVEVVYLG